MVQDGWGIQGGYGMRLHDNGSDRRGMVGGAATAFSCFSCVWTWA